MFVSSMYGRNYCRTIVTSSGYRIDQTLVTIQPVTWECDYPHSDATWPRSPEVLAGYLTDVPDDEVDTSSSGGGGFSRITHSNALRLYSFDMFKHLPKGELTVALRAQATDVDLGFRSSERLRKTGTDTVTVLAARRVSPPDFARVGPGHLAPAANLTTSSPRSVGSSRRCA